MTKKELIPFDHVLKPEIKILAEVKCLEESLEVTFNLYGDLSNISLPIKEDEPRRIIGLWEFTCLEIFIKDLDSPQYLEFNFSPEFHWNCFIFQKPRIKLVEYLEIEDIEQSSTRKTDHYQHIIKLNTSKFPREFTKMGRRQIGLSAVIANSHNKLSYWSLKHNKDKPDFHDPNGMTIIL